VAVADLRCDSYSVRYDTEYDAHGRVVFGSGLTLRPNPHRFEVDGRTLYTWCALDADLSCHPRPVSAGQLAMGSAGTVRHPDLCVLLLTCCVGPAAVRLLRVAVGLVAYSPSAALPRP
jgi:hypothetical protein